MADQITEIVDIHFEAARALELCASYATTLALHLRGDQVERVSPEVPTRRNRKSGVAFSAKPTQQAEREGAVRRMLTVLAALAALLGVAVAVERPPKVEGPQVREKTQMERWKEMPSARAAEHVLDLYLSGQREEAERQLKAYQGQFGADAIDVPLPSRSAPRQLPGPR